MKTIAYLQTLICITFAFGCADVPKQKYFYRSQIVIDKNYDEVWEAINNNFVKGKPIKYFNKAKGVVISDELSVEFINTDKNEFYSKYCDCDTDNGAKNYFMVNMSHKIYEKKVTDNSTSVNIIANYKGLNISSDEGEWDSCYSKGVFEHYFIYQIQKALNIKRAVTGIGFKDPNIVTELAENSPAKKAGIQVGDEIVEIDERAIKSSGEVFALLSGEANTKVSIKIRRGNTYQVFILNREILK